MRKSVLYNQAPPFDFKVFAGYMSHRSNTKNRGHILQYFHHNLCMYATLMVRRWITHTGGITHIDSSIHYYKTHIFWDTLLQHTHFPTHIISTYIIPIQIYFDITSIWVCNIQTHTYLSINVFTHTAICIQTHIYFRIWLIWPHII